jgi:hypothetical protein
MAERSYMPDHVSLAGIGTAALLIVATIAVAAVGAYAVIRLGGDSAAARVSAHPVTTPPISAPVVLQQAPARDIGTYRDEQRRLLDSYRWIDSLRGIARIPIGRAMALLARRGEAARNPR